MSDEAFTLTIVACLPDPDFHHFLPLIFRLADSIASCFSFQNILRRFPPCLSALMHGRLMGNPALRNYLKMLKTPLIVIPAKAGIQFFLRFWTPASAGVTV
jgi:hypothetical protein